VLSKTHCAEPAGGKRPGVTCQSFFVPLPVLSKAHSAPSPPRLSGRAVRVSQSVRVSAGPGFGPGQSGHVRARPTGRSGQGQFWPVGAASLCRGRVSLSEPAGPSSQSLRFTSGLTRTVPSGARSWSRPLSGRMFLGKGPRPRGPASGRGQAGRGLVLLRVRFAGPPPSLDFCLPAAPFLFIRPFLVHCSLILFIVPPLYTS
jgi:hypothetical protein